MKIAIISFLVVGFFICSAIASGNINTINGKAVNLKDTLNPIWFRTWGGSYKDQAAAVAIDNKSVYVAGYTYNHDYSNFDAIVLKYDMNGNLVWNRTWGGIGNDQATSIALNSTNVFVAGFTTSYGASRNDVFLLNYNKSGYLNWNRTWGGKYDDQATSVAIHNQTIYVTGNTNSTGAGGVDAFLLKYDLVGNLTWNKTWGGASFDYGTSIAINNTNMCIAGETTSYGNGSYDAVILKYDLNGNLAWNRTWGGNGSDGAYAVATDNKSIYAVGYTTSYYALGNDVLVLKYDWNGNRIWNRTWGGKGDDEADSIAVDSTNIYVAGFTFSYGVGSGDAFIIKYDLDGNIVWNKTWGGGANDGAHSIAINSMNIYLAGFTFSYSAGEDDAFVLKTDLNGGNSPPVPELVNILVPAMLMIAVCAIMISFRRKNHFCN